MLSEYAHVMTEGLRVGEGTIVRMSATEGIIVESDSSGNVSVACNYLRTAEGKRPLFSEGMKVLFTMPDQEGKRGCILGIVESSNPAERESGEQTPALIEDDIVSITARRGLVIQCGKGSITITEDGRVQIEGTYLLSRSRGVNKIKGGSVKIN